MEGDYADGITKEEALELTKGVFKEKIKALRGFLNQRCGYIKNADDVSTALKMMFMVVVLPMRRYGMLSRAEKDGYSAFS